MLQIVVIVVVVVVVVVVIIIIIIIIIILFLEKSLVSTDSVYVEVFRYNLNISHYHHVCNC
jgi:hypothetical protein